MYTYDSYDEKCYYKIKNEVTTIIDTAHFKQWVKRADEKVKLCSKLRHSFRMIYLGNITLKFNSIKCDTAW